MFPWIEALTPIIGKLVDLIPDPNARQKALLETQAQLVKIASEQAAQQSEINKAEAENPNLFVAGWRPAIGWVCAIAFAWTYVAFPVVTWFGTIIGLPNLPAKPILDGNLLELTLGMLGLGALRSFDKLKGTSK